MSDTEPWNKPLDRMDRLTDMLHFPALVNAGATLNILLTITVTWWLVPRFPQIAAPAVWIAAVLVLNLAPVVLLRRMGANSAPIPRLSQMSFVGDQHRFSDWVYLAASANMTFWILLAWSVFSYRRSVAVLAGVLLLAFVATFSPVLLRPLRARRS